MKMQHYIDEHIKQRINLLSDKLDWSCLSENPKLTWDIVKDNHDKKWNWLGLSMNPNITWEIVKENPDKPWNWYYLSKNPNITWDIVNKYPVLT